MRYARILSYEAFEDGNSVIRWYWVDIENVLMRMGGYTSYYRAEASAIAHGYQIWEG